jgi:hypothetical protein
MGASRPATLDEVHEAIESLSDADHATLYVRAEKMTYGTRYSDPFDLVHDALLASMEGAKSAGAKGRQWPRDVPFLAYLTMAMKGIASNGRTSLAGRSEVLASELAGDGEEDAGDLLEFIASANSPGIDQQLMDAQDADEVIIRRDELFARFAEDGEVSLILMAMEDGDRGEAIWRNAGLDKLQYEAARKRLRRGVAEMRAARSAK